MSTPFSLSQKIKDLETIEEYFQKPDMDLEEAIVKHKEALAIAKELMQYLEKAESTIRKVDIAAVLGDVSSESTE